MHIVFGLIFILCTSYPYVDSYTETTRCQQFGRKKLRLVFSQYIRTLTGLTVPSIAQDWVNSRCLVLIAGAFCVPGTCYTTVKCCCCMYCIRGLQYYTTRPVPSPQSLPTRYLTSARMTWSIPGNVFENYHTRAYIRPLVDGVYFCFFRFPYSAYYEIL